MRMTSCQLSDRKDIRSLVVCLSQTALADRERDLAELVTKVEQLQLARERQALKTAEMEKTVETLTQQRDARNSAAAEAASQLNDDVRTLRLALDETSRRERQVSAASVNYTVISIFDHDNKPKGQCHYAAHFYSRGYSGEHEHTVQLYSDV